MAGSDGRSFVFGDVFGIVRVTLGKKLSLKTTSKATAPHGGVTVDGLGKLALANGRVQTGVYGEEGLFLLNLPGLGIRLKQPARSGPVAFAGDLVVALEDGRLELQSIQADGLAPERSLPLVALTRKLPGREVGPQIAGKAKDRGRRLLHVHPDGRFAAYADGRLWGGRIGSVASEDKLSWSLEVALHPTVALGLVRLDTAVWLTVMDHAADKARLLSIDDRSASPEMVLLELDAIGLPAVTDEHIVYQPSGDLVVRRTLRSGAEERFEVAAFNAHPHPEPEPSFYAEKTTPPPPGTTRSRLSARLYAPDEHILFVPWHAETVVELTSGQILDRGLLAGAGPMRRGLREIVARDNVVLAELQLEAELDPFDTVPKRSQCRMGVWLPQCPATVLSVVASGYAHRLTDRFALKTHGWGWGSFGGQGNIWGSPPTADLAATRQLLGWMIGADLLPLETDGEVGPLYTEMLGIPGEPHPDRRPFEADAERLWLRATLETIGACGWPESQVPESWAREPITPAMALVALRGLSSWSRRRPYNGLHLVSCVLTHHLDRAAQPVLLSLITDHPVPFNWKQYRDAGELLVWLCRRYPDLSASSHAAIGAINHPDRQWPSEKQVILDALARGARHLWSNG